MKKLLAGALALAMLAAAPVASAETAVGYTTYVNGKPQTVPVSAGNPLPVNASVTANATVSPFTPAQGYAEVTAGTTNQRFALHAGDTAIDIVNGGSTDLKYAFGDATVDATTSNLHVLAGREKGIGIPNGATYVAFATASSTTTVDYSTGAGLIAVAGGGGSGSGTPTGTAGSPNASTVSVQGIGGGTPLEVNAISNDFADGAIITLGNTGDAAWSGTGGGTEIAIGKAIRNLLAGTLTVNLSSIGTAATAANQSSEITQLSNANTVLGTTSDSAWTGSGAGSLDAINKAIWSKLNGGITVNLGTIGSVATAANQSSQITQETNSANALGSTGDAAYAGSGTASVVAGLKGVYSILSTIQSQPSTVKGTVASGSAGTDPPVYAGCRAATTVPSAVSDGQVVAQMCSKAGKPVVDLFAPVDLQTDAALLTLSSTTETQIGSAGAAGVFLDMVRIKLCNTSASSVRVDIKDQYNVGSVVDTWVLPAGDCRGQNFSPPLRQGTAAAAWSATLSGAVTDVRIKAGFIQRK